MYDSRNENLIIVIVTPLFLVAILVIAVRRNLFRKFRFSSPIEVLNWAFVIQLKGIILLIVSLILENSIDAKKPPSPKSNYHEFNDN